MTCHVWHCGKSDTESRLRNLFFCSHTSSLLHAKWVWYCSGKVWYLTSKLVCFYVPWFPKLFWPILSHSILFYSRTSYLKIKRKTFVFVKKIFDLSLKIILFILLSRNKHQKRKCINNFIYFFFHLKTIRAICKYILSSIIQWGHA